MPVAVFIGGPMHNTQQVVPDHRPTQSFAERCPRECGQFAVKPADTVVRVWRHVYVWVGYGKNGRDLLYHYERTDSQ